MKILVAGGGWSGCSAALTAKKNGAEVTLLERTDMLLGTGLAGGIMRNNGRLAAAEEMTALGGGFLFELIEQNLRHKNISFPGQEHADLYDIFRMPEAVLSALSNAGIQIHLQSRLVKITKEKNRILCAFDEAGGCHEADAFIDATGSAGPMNNCGRYGNGCAMCVLRCPSFGGRISLTGLAGIQEISGKNASGSTGAMSGSCKLSKESLSKELVFELNEKGVVLLPIPERLREDHLSLKCCQQYALKEFTENVILLDTGHAKFMAPFYSLEKLHQIPGLEHARYEDPYSGGKGNSMRYFAMSPRDNTLKVIGADNLFCAGEKAGLLVGHTEAIATGALAGYNAVRYVQNQKLLVLPRTLATGEAVAFVKEEMETAEGLCRKYTFSGSFLWNRLKELGLDGTDVRSIRKRVEKAGLTGVFSGLNPVF